MKRKNSIVLCFNCKLKIALGISLGGNLKDNIPTQHSLFLRVHSAKTIITHTEELHLLLNYIEKSFCESEFSWDLYALIISKVLRMINIWSGGFVLKLVLILLQSFKTNKKLLGKSGQECSFQERQWLIFPHIWWIYHYNNAEGASEHILTKEELLHLKSEL